MGGRMTTGAEATEKKKAAAGKKAGAGKRTSKPAREKRSKPRTGKSRGPEQPEPDEDDGKGLNQEALGVMGDRGSKLAEELMKRAMRGDPKSTNMLAELAKKEADVMEALERGPLRSQALAWAAEPPWQDELDEEKAETGIGVREPE